MGAATGRWAVELAVSLTIGVALIAPPIHAADFTVDSTTDAVDVNIGDGVCAAAGGECTLRAAIQETNALPGKDSISLGPGIHLLSIAGWGEDASATGDLDITGELVLSGVGSASTIVDGGGTDAVFHVLPGGSAQISSITITGGSSENGRGIWNQGRLWIVSSLVRENWGSIFNEGSAIITATAVETTGIGDSVRLAIENSGQLLLLKTDVTNSWHGITNNGTLTMIDSSVTDHSGDGTVGIFNQYSALLTLIRTTVSENSGSGLGGIQNRGTVLGSGVIVSDNLGGHRSGIINESTGVVELTNSSITGNRNGQFAGGIENDGTLRLTNTTISGNCGWGEIGNTGTARLTSITLAEGDPNCPWWGDPHPVIRNESSLELKSTVVAASTLNCENTGSIISLGNNLDQDGSCGFTGPGDMTADPLLEPLADNGGPSLTHALQPGSPALDAIDPADCTYDDDGDPATPDVPLERDQRDFPRPSGVGCDIGAFELKAIQPNHFKCYRASPPFGTQRLDLPAHLADQFEEKDFTALWAYEVCTPVDKNGEGIPDPTAHLTCYKIKQDRGQERFERRSVLMDNQLGEDQELKVKRSYTLCVPSTKTELEP